MVITQERLLDGFAKYAENDFINKIAGPMKWVIAVSISFILSEGLKMIEENKEMLTKDNIDNLINNLKLVIDNFYIKKYNITEEKISFIKEGREL